MKVVVSKKISTAFSAILGAFMPTSFLSLTSCGDANTIQLANYESYMANDLIEDLERNYNIQFPHYTTAETIETKFQRFYDIAVPPGYELLHLLELGCLHEIDWTKFGLGITDAEDAKKIFEPTMINAMNKQCEDYIIALPEGHPLKAYLVGGKFNILRFGVPYFAQSFIFAYKSDNEMKFFTPSGVETSNPNWQDIYYTVYNSEMFKPEKGLRVGMVDDSKSIYDIARIAETKTTNQIPGDDSQDRMKETFKQIQYKQQGKKSFFTLNSDSGVISRGLADPNGYAAAFTWSGDTIYAAKGAEEFEKDIARFHVQDVYGCQLDEIEFMVINKKNEKDEFKEKMDDIYNVIKQICLDAAGASDEQIAQKEGDRYRLWSVENFDNINYTPMLKSIYDATTNATSKYWTNQTDLSVDEIALYIKILTQPTRESITHLFGRTLTHKQNSNTHWAWISARGKF